MPKFTPIEIPAMGEKMPRGPIPKPSDERRRTNSPEPQLIEPLDDEPIECPALPLGLHPLAANWYNSLAYSAQSRLYLPSDWQVAVALTVQYSNALEEAHAEGRAIPASQFSAIIEGMTQLMSTPASRLRAHVEVRRAAGPTVEATPAIDYRARMNQGGRRQSA